MRKYLFGTGIITALFGVIPVIKASRDDDRDWRVFLIWGSWLITVALAVAAIVETAKEDQLES